MHFRDYGRLFSKPIQTVEVVSMIESRQDNDRSVQSNKRAVFRTPM
jgi:hypothetical protein